MNYSLIWRLHHCRWKAEHLDLWSALIGIEHLGFFTVTHLYCDKGHPFIMVIFEDPDTHTYCRAFSSGTATTCFYELGLSRLGFEHPTFRLRGQRSNPQSQRRDFLKSIQHIIYNFIDNKCISYNNIAYFLSGNFVSIFSLLYIGLS